MQLLNRLSSRLKTLSDTASLDAQVLLAHVLGKSRAWVLAHPEVALTPEQEQALESAMRRLESGEPLPYVLGHREFFGLDFIVTPDTLIPRPETEALVEQALVWLRGRGKGSTLWAADAGTGSGCIAVALAAHAPGLHIVACDLSLPALQVAQRNASQHLVGDRLQFVQADLLPPIDRPLDLICANLPYVPSGTLRSLPVYQREPVSALDGGLDGLDAIRRFLLVAPRRLCPAGLLLMEIEAGQRDAVRSLAQGAFPEAQVEVIADLAGRDRIVRVERL